VNVAGGLLAAAAILSLVLGRWDILIGVTPGLVTVVAADLFAWRSNQTDEPRKWLDLSQMDDNGRTTYYYDDEDTLSASGAGDDERGLQSDLVEKDDEGNRPR
jgi:hypothetical protein